MTNTFSLAQEESDKLREKEAEILKLTGELSKAKDIIVQQAELICGNEEVVNQRCTRLHDELFEAREEIRDLREDVLGYQMAADVEAKAATVARTELDYLKKQLEVLAVNPVAVVLNTQRGMLARMSFDQWQDTQPISEVVGIKGE